MKNNFLKIYLPILLLVGLSLLSSADLSQAQFSLDTDFLIQLSPSSPGPNTETTAEIITYSFDVNRASITWILNGEIVLEGVGEKTLKFSTDSLGETTTLKALVTTTEGASQQKTITLVNAEVDLLWKADSYTPSWYKGKALAIPGSEIKVIAFPNFPGISPGNLIYKWTKNYKNVSSASGFGKRNFVFNMPNSPYVREKIGLTVSNVSETIIAKKTIQIEAASSKALLYENSPLEGPLFQTSLKNFILRGERVEIKAEPFFLPKEEIKNLFYKWSVNDEEVSAETGKGIFSVTIAPDITASLSLQLDINNPVNILQFIQTKLQITKE